MKMALLDRSSGVMFIPVSIDKTTAIAGDGNQYEIGDCRPVSIEDFNTDRILIGDEGTEFLVSRCVKGLRFDGRLRVQLADEVEKSAKSLAEFFNGVVVDVPEKFAIQEEVDDDW